MRLPRLLRALLGGTRPRVRVPRRRVPLVPRPATAARSTTHVRRRPHVPVAVKRRVWERDGGRCVQCGARQDLQFDHVIPLSWGGATTEENLQVLCRPCNLRKGARRL